MNTLVFQRVLRGAVNVSDSLGQVVPCTAGRTSKPRLASRSTEIALSSPPDFLRHCHLPCLVHLKGTGPLFAFSAFCGRGAATCAFCGHLDADLGDAPAWLSSERLHAERKSKDNGASGELSCPPCQGNRNSPAERRKARKEKRIYYSRAITHSPTSIFQIVKFFLCNHFPLKRKK